MLRWWALSVATALAAVLFGFDGISSGPHALRAIVLVGVLAMAVPIAAEVVRRRPAERP